MRMILTALAIAGSVSGVALAHEPQRDGTCSLIRISPEGRRIVINDQDERYEAYRGSAGRSGAGRSDARAFASSSGSSSSSVAIASSSHGGRTSASATTRGDGGRRTVTTTHDQNGCTTVIDERPAQRRNR